MTAIYKREMRSYFTSPVGYIFVALFLAVSAFIFMDCTVQAGEKSNVAAYFMYILYIFIIIIPLITMKLLSEERKMRTDQLILTSPVSLFGMVLAKFLAASEAHSFFLPLSIISLSQNTERPTSQTIFVAPLQFFLRVRHSSQSASSSRRLRKTSSLRRSERSRRSSCS